MQKVTPFLWFPGNMGEALELYTSVFKNSKITSKNGGPGGGLFTATFEIEDQKFIGLNWQGSPAFTDAISFVINCHTQDEVDYYWEKLTADGGKEVQCGWLKDKFGVSWQVTPQILGELMGDPDPAKSQRVMQAMMKMVKIDIAGLKAAYEG